MTRPANHTTTKAGFTLIEVLVSVALSALIMVGLFSMFGSVVEVASDIRTREGASYGERALESIFFTDLRSVYPGSMGNFRFEGHGGEALGENGLLMTFCTTASLSTQVQTHSLQRVEYRVVDNFKTKSLVRSEYPYCGQDGDWEAVDVIVMDQLRSVRAEYDDPDDNEYTDIWAPSKGYPSAVRLIVTPVRGQETTLTAPLSSMARSR